MTTKTKPKRLLEYTVFVLLLGTGLALAQLAFEGNNIDGVQVIAGKNSSTGKSAVPKVNSSGELLVVSPSSSSASCAHIRSSGATSVAANSSGTTIDAGATGTGYWSTATNLGRTFSLDVAMDTGNVTIPPLQSFTWALSGAATPDNASFKNNGTLGSTSAATYAEITTCDDD